MFSLSTQGHGNYYYIALSFYFELGFLGNIEASSEEAPKLTGAPSQFHASVLDYRLPYIVVTEHVTFCMAELVL